MHEPKSILLVRLCCVGDVLKTTPVLKALRDKFPGSKIAYLISSWALDTIIANPYIDEIITFDGAYSRNPIKKMASPLPILIKIQGFDWAFIFHRTPMASLLTLLGGVRERIGFIDSKSNRFLTHPVKYDPSKHEIDRYIALAESMGIEVVDRAPKLYLSEEAKKRGLELLKLRGIDSPFIAIHPGGGSNPGKFMPIKRWLPERFAELANILVGDLGQKVLWVGGKEDLLVMDKVRKHLKVRTHEILGKTSFLELAGVLKRCSLFIGGDSGPLYIAASVGAKTIGIFGPTDPRKLAPRGQSHRVIWKHLDCSPCHTPQKAHEDFSTCPLGTHDCMKKIEVQDVLETVLELIDLPSEKRIEKTFEL